MLIGGSLRLDVDAMGRIRGAGAATVGSVSAAALTAWTCSKVSFLLLLLPERFLLANLYDSRPCTRQRFTVVQGASPGSSGETLPSLEVSCSTLFISYLQ